MQEEVITRARFIKYSKRLTRNIAMDEPEYVNCGQLRVLLGSNLFLLPPLIYRVFVPGVQMWVRLPWGI